MKKTFSLILLLTVNCLLSTDTKAQNNWQVLNTNTNLSLLSLQCLGTDTVFMYGDNGIILQSDNAGDTFDTHYNGTAAISMAGFFFDKDTGMVSTGSGNISRTTNGGSNWNSTGGCGCLIDEICFSNNRIGLFGSTNGVFSSLDGGNSWSQIASPYFHPTEIISLDDSVFIANYHNIIFKTNNAGASWVTDTLNYSGAYYLTGMSFYNSQNGFVISADGHLFSSHNAGDSWNLVANIGLTSNNLFLVFTDSLNGYLVSGSSRKNIYKTTNGGLAWSLDYTSTDVIEKLEYDGKHVFACGQNGLALRKEIYPTSVSTLNEKEIHIYPNPVAEQLTIDNGQLTRNTIEIRDMLGRIIYTEQLNSPLSIVRYQLLSSGIYFLRITDGKNYSVVKFEKL